MVNDAIASLDNPGNLITSQTAGTFNVTDNQRNTVSIVQSAGVINITGSSNMVGVNNAGGSNTISGTA